MNEEMKNQTEQLPLLKVHMMGSFFLEYGDQPISFRKTMATKSMRLLQIFLYNKDNGISRGRLLESTYGREDVADAANSLRVGVHRLKEALSRQDFRSLSTFIHRKAFTTGPARCRSR